LASGQRQRAASKHGNNHCTALQPQATADNIHVHVVAAIQRWQLMPYAIIRGGPPIQHASNQHSQKKLASQCPQLPVAASSPTGRPGYQGRAVWDWLFELL
jgi:hypothetical protein